MTTVNCRICDTVFEGEFLRVKEMMFGTGHEFDYFQCSGCGCLQLVRVPEDMSIYYNNEYYTGKRAFDIQSSLKKMIYRIRAKISVSPLYGVYSLITDYTIEKCIHYSNVNYNSKILDVGCGSGDLLYNFHNYGFRDLTGIDPYLKNASETAGTRFLNKELAELEGNFDLIIFNHSFEHIPDQFKALEDAKSKLTGSGVIFIRMPVVSYAFEKYKENWVQLDAPRHSIIHTEKSMELLCSRAGLNVEHVYYDSTDFQFWGSEQYKSGITLNSPKSYSVNPDGSIFKEEDIKKFSKEADRLNKQKSGDQAAFVIRPEKL